MNFFAIAFGAFGLAAAIAALSVSFFLSRRASRAVQAVTEAAHRLAEGELDLQVQAPYSPQSRRLADSFNLMALTLRTTIQNLSGERNKLSAVLDTMADGVVVVEPGGIVLLANPAAQAMLAVTEAQILGRRLVEVMRDDQIQRLIADCISTRRSQRGDVELLRPRRFLSVAATPLAEDSSRQVLLTLHDLTGLRQTETSHREFVSNVSHELRNPLASVRAMVETLEDGAIDEREVARNFLERIRHDTDRMNHLVDDLLELSRLESGQLTLQLGAVDLAALVVEVKASFEHSANDQGIALVIQVTNDLPTLSADADRLRQVLINLVENALRFTRPNGEITISAVQKPKFIEVLVRDTGVGMSSEHLPHLFERFYKVDRSRRHGGTGLGLAIVKQIVEAHGGQVWAESKEGEGSAFYFTLPRLN
ncbi:MAG: ATP-binding protein [Chloroflexi bacterium]|nr:ATP-binding protein [Chloroflexota bacterium]MDA1219033.1 ATP-binding protein [Chloroflexota bacterium]